MDNFHDAHIGNSINDGHHSNMGHTDDNVNNHHIAHHVEGGLHDHADSSHKNIVGMDGFTGHGADNSDLIMSYQDPLAHSTNYHMEPFHVNGGVDVHSNSHAGDSNSMVHGVETTTYTVAAHGGLMPDIGSANELVGVKNGMLVNATSLDSIIAMGEVQGAHHIDSAHETRSEAVRDEFLHLNGYTSIPAGYEVHHIVPLSEGGADDVHNMILLRDDEHAAVTAAHKQYYGWGNNT